MEDIKETDYEPFVRPDFFLIMAIFVSSLLVQIKFSFLGFHYGVYNLLIPLFSFWLIIINRRKIPELFHSFKLVIGVFVILYLWCWISAFLSPYKHIALKFTLKYTSYFILFFAFLVSTYDSPQKQIHFQLKTVIYFLCFLAFMGIIEYFFPHAQLFYLLKIKKFYLISSSMQNPNPFGVLMRISSLMQNPNPFGVLMSIGAILSIILQKKGIINKWELPFLIPLFIINIAFSASRNSWMVFILGLFLLHIYKVINPTKALLLILLWLGCVLYSPVSTHKIGIKSNLFPLAKWMENLKVEKTKKGKNSAKKNERNHIETIKKAKKQEEKMLFNNLSLNNLIPKQVYSSPGRIELWKKAFIEFKNRPFIGIGIRIFDEVKAQEVWMQGYNTHDLFLNILVELGLVGFCISLWLGYLVLKRINFKDPLWAVPIILILAGQVVDCFLYDFTFMSVSLYLLAVSLVSHE